MNHFRVFEADQIEAIGMPVAITLMREAFRMLSEGKVKVPLRTAMETEDHTGMALFMPSYAPEWNLFGLKMVSVFSNNRPSLPAIQGEMLVMDAKNGKLLAILNAPAVTSLRTGAASGMATDLLAHPDATELAIFGTGVQAWTQVAGVLAVRKITRIRVKGTSTEHEKAFCAQVADRFNVACQPLGGLSQLKEVQIICTATNAEQPLFERAHVHPGVHINAIGAYKPHMRELSEDLIADCKLIVDQREAVCKEAGEVAIPIQAGRLTKAIIHAELGEVVAGKEGRKAPDEITVFKSVGNAVQDLAIARYLLRETQA